MLIEMLFLTPKQNMFRPNFFVWLTTNEQVIYIYTYMTCTKKISSDDSDMLIAQGRKSGKSDGSNTFLKYGPFK